ncbi:MAG: HD domain-containing protein [Lachnospiraceae bacterium]|nr:HD domain-containing protein [Lachnospiraceae bacterium]
MREKRLIRLVLSAALTVFLTLNCFSMDGFAAKNREILGEGTDFTAILYDSSNGLPTSEANAIAQSSDGFIWLGGYSGFIRYDGTEFHRFDSSSGISSVFSLYVDESDRVWIGTNENGLSYYDHGTIFNYGRAEEMNSYSVRAISEDKEGNILVATTQGMAYVAPDLSLHPINDSRINDQYIDALIRSESGDVFGLTKEGAFFEVNNLSITAYHEPGVFGENAVNCLYPDPDDDSILYMGTTDDEVLVVSMGETLEIVEKVNTGNLSNINCIRKNKDKIWLCATDGIGYLDKDLQFCEVSDIPMTGAVGSMMVDHEGNLWFTSTRQGVMKIVPDRFSDLSKIVQFPSVVVNTTCVVDNLLYVGTDNGLKIIDLSTHEMVENNFTKQLSDIRIRCIMQDSGGNLWVCSHGEHGLICKKKGGSVIEFNARKGIEDPKKMFRTVTETSDGRIIAVTGSNVYVIEDFNITGCYSNDTIGKEPVLCACEGDDGILYFGTDGGGICVVEKNKVSRIEVTDGLTSGVVMRIKKDEDRNLYWIITSNSIQYMKDGVITAVTEFPYSNNYDIFTDDVGGAWVLSSNGIYITKVDQLLENKNIEYTFYNTKSGLPYTPTGNSRNCVSDGILYISGTTGICAVDINKDGITTEDVRLVISSVCIDDKTTVPCNESSITIPAGSKRFRIDAYVITYGLGNPRISYMLEGFDREPIYMTKQELKTISYTNINGGRYTFTINVLDDETGEVVKTASYGIVKETSIYENTWFWIVFMIIGIFIIAFILWNYFRKKNDILIAKQKEDQKFIDEILKTFAKCIDMRDQQNRGHSFRVAYYTRLLADKLAYKRGYSEEQVHEFHNIALLHDIGKLSIPDAILNKKERLDDEEYKIMKTHAQKGEELLKNVKIVKNLAIGAGAHHERIDGKGYPRGLSGDEIPEVARIIAVADTFDAMYSTRPYRKQLELSTVLEEIKRIRGVQLDPEVVDALLELANEGMLNKEKAEAEVEKAPEIVLYEETDSGEDLAKKNEEFLNSLGLKG